MSAPVYTYMVQVGDYVKKRQDSVYATIVCKCWNDKKQALPFTRISYEYIYIILLQYVIVYFSSTG
jgi:hypothetical protein